VPVVYTRRPSGIVDQISLYLGQFKIESAGARSSPCEKRVYIHFTIANAFITSRKLRLSVVLETP